MSCMFRTLNQESAVKITGDRRASFTSTLKPVQKTVVLTNAPGLKGLKKAYHLIFKIIKNTPFHHILVKSERNWPKKFFFKILVSYV